MCSASGRQSIKRDNMRKNFQKFMLLWFGELVSSIGSGLTSFGLGVYVFRQTGSAADMALVSLLAFLPTLLLSVPAGVPAELEKLHIDYPKNKQAPRMGRL